MKIIFLDIDGVLNNDEDLYSDDALNDALIGVLAQIIDRTDAKVVLSSTWRMSVHSLSKVMDALARFNLSLYGITPENISLSKLKNTCWEELAQETIARHKANNICIDRGAEIAAWLIDHRNIENYVILDDDDADIKDYFPDNLVHINFHTGLTEQDAIAAINILKRGD